MIEQLEDMAGRSRVSRVLARSLRDLEPGTCCTQFWADLRAPFPGDVS